MNFLQKIFGRKDSPISSNKEFWQWFMNNERAFHKVVKERGDIQKIFLNKLSERLDELKDGFFFLTGMLDDSTVELIITADGNLSNIFFVEQLINAAPKIDGWKFTALKPALAIEDVAIETGGLNFRRDNLSFYANDTPGCPDEIDITVVYDNVGEVDTTTIGNGVYLFLDNYLGELNFATTIDNLKIITKENTDQELVPIEKLKDYLIWREKEFVEKYGGIRRNTENDAHSVMEAELESGNTLIAVVNTELLKWYAKASHPWILKVEINFDDGKNRGMPDDETYNELDQIGEEILKNLEDADGYLNVGRQTANSVREIYFACAEFRKPSQVLHEIQRKYALKHSVSYKIYKDKYWMSFNRFIKPV